MDVIKMYTLSGVHLCDDMHNVLYAISCANYTQ